MSERERENSRNSSPEVPEKASRRGFDAAYKLKILEEAAARYLSQRWHFPPLSSKPHPPLDTSPPQQHARKLNRSPCQTRRKNALVAGRSRT